MIRIEFLGPIDKDPMELDISNLQELSDVLSRDAALAEWLENCAVAVNDTMVNTLDHPLQEGDRVSLLPPVCGG